MVSEAELKLVKTHREWLMVAQKKKQEQQKEKQRAGRGRLGREAGQSGSTSAGLGPRL